MPARNADCAGAKMANASTHKVDDCIVLGVKMRLGPDAAAAMDEHLAKTIYWNYTNRVFQAALLKKCSFGYTDSSQPKVPES